MELSLVCCKLLTGNVVLLQIFLEFARAVLLDETFIHNVVHLSLLLNKVANIVQVANKVGMTIPLLWSENTALQKVLGAFARRLVVPRRGFGS